MGKCNSNSKLESYRFSFW